MKIGRPPIGYLHNPEDDQKFIIDEDVAEIVRGIFTRIIGGDGVAKIAADFNRRKIDTAITRWNRKAGMEIGEDPHHWSGTQVQQIAQNRTYLGERVLQKYTTVSYKNQDRSNCELCKFKIKARSWSLRKSFNFHQNKISKSIRYLWIFITYVLL
ncbi:hypothetical protein FACS1894132_13500 [Clostridia bacterium]|nr:hypothetical protein FACS1894132_13500 [Clostridia bacterium]